MDFYGRLGVRKVISCCGTFTILGGALMDPRVLETMTEASRTHVVLEELLEKAGQRVAELAGVEAAYITTGAAGGLFLSTAALLAGTDPERIARLPDTSGIPGEALICHCQRFLFDQAIRTAGATLVEIGDASGTTRSDMEAAIGERTAFGVWVADRSEGIALPFESFCEVAHDHGLPVLVDNAAEIPPLSNLRKYSDLGADLVVFSGGKGLRGPQSTGLILGRPELIAACAANSNPHHTIGRPLKVGKEEICGLVRALELYVEEISKRELGIWEGMVGHILDSIEGIPGVRAWRHFPYRPCRDVPVLAIELSAELGVTVPQILAALESGDPPIFAPAPESGFGYAPGRGLIINPHTMLEGEERVVARRLREVLGGTS